MSCECHFEDTSYLSGWCGASPNVTLFMSLVDLMIRSNCILAEPCKRILQRQQYPQQYDFIVIGAGVAGSVVASRLSEQGKWNVLLLEAGPDEPTTTTIPAFAVSAIGSSLDWKYRTQPQNTACLNRGGSCYWPRGKMVGGTGAMTGMMYTRGHHQIFDDWAKAGNTGWTFQECLPFFIKSERNGNPELVDEGFHGFKGPLPVQQFSYHPSLALDLLKAGKQLGYRNGDLNGKNQTGFAIAQMMVQNGFRASTARAYLRPASSRPNLFARVNSTVTKLIIDKTSKRVLGVKYVHQNKTCTAWARKEVILSAGAVGSPHILLLSGVGPKEDLAKHNIDVVQDLKVGHNLHNHVSTSVKFYISDPNKRMLTMDSLKEYMKHRTGPMASTGLTQTTAFMKSKYAKDIPDLQVFFDGFSASCSASGHENECSDGMVKPNCGEREIRARPTNVMTHSKGNLTLRSSNPFDPPLIYGNYFSDTRDVEILIDGIKQVIKVSETDAMKKWNMRLSDEKVKNCEQHVFKSDEYWECVVRTNTGPENHQAGSCKMGPNRDPTAVVDPELRVHGINNLRVIDASVFPYLPNSNPIAAIVMMAEKGSHMIKSAWTRFPGNHRNGTKVSAASTGVRLTS